MREEKSIKKKRERESEYRNKGYYYTKRAKLCSTNAVQDAYVTSTWMDGIVL